MTETMTPPDVKEITRMDDGDHDRFSHYVIPPAAITRSAVTGEPVIAICGKVWVPTRDPDGFDLCPTCAELKAMIDRYYDK